MEEFIEGIAALDVVEERLHGNTGAHEHRRAAKYFWVAVDDCRLQSGRNS